MLQRRGNNRRLLATQKGLVAFSSARSICTTLGKPGPHAVRQPGQRVCSAAFFGSTATAKRRFISVCIRAHAINPGRVRQRRRCGRATPTSAPGVPSNKRPNPHQTGYHRKTAPLGVVSQMPARMPGADLEGAGQEPRCIRPGQGVGTACDRLVARRIDQLPASAQSVRNTPHSVVGMVVRDEDAFGPVLTSSRARREPRHRIDNEGAFALGQQPDVIVA